MVLEDSGPDGSQAFALLSDSFKGCILHKLRMEYAETMQEYLTDEQFLQYLDGSFEAWMEMTRSLYSSETAEEFLRPSANGNKCAASCYIRRDDRQYFETLCALYNSVQHRSPYGLFVKEICAHLTFKMTVEEVSSVYSASCDRNMIEIKGYVEFGQMYIGENYEIASRIDDQECSAVMKCLGLTFRRSKDGGYFELCVLEGTGVGNIKRGQILMYSNTPTPFYTHPNLRSPSEPDAGTHFLMGIESMSIRTLSNRGTFVAGRVEQGRLKVGETVEFVSSPYTIHHTAVVSAMGILQWSEDCIERVDCIEIGDDDVICLLCDIEPGLDPDIEDYSDGGFIIEDFISGDHCILGFGTVIDIVE